MLKKQRSRKSAKPDNITFTLQRLESGQFSFVDEYVSPGPKDSSSRKKKKEPETSFTARSGDQESKQERSVVADHEMSKTIPDRTNEMQDGDSRRDEENEEKLIQDQINQTEKKYQQRAFIIPSCAQWFDLQSIHEIEMQTLPEFFCDKFPHKNPETYQNYRNFIIKLYRENPSAYLSATECRKKLPGDICSIIRLHAFLEHWGLINFNVEPYLRPAKIQLGESGNVSN